MSAVPVISLPTRSQIEDCTAAATLDTAATRWRGIADQSEQVFDEHRATVVSTDWSGDAKDAAVNSATAAVGVVGNQNRVVRDSATLAENGSADVKAARKAVLDAIAAAENDGFQVKEDLSVRDARRVDVFTMSARQTAMAEHAEDIRWHAEKFAQTKALVNKRLTANAEELNGIRFNGQDDGTVQAVDLKQAPPPSPPYPINDVIAEATDLDGNHVVMRRGYYDATTQEGFGWDKIYWKHGIVNPNVLKDLISHSHPKENLGGTLVYDVPINKTHCTSGFLGLPSCTDTGESLTMRIVANTNPSPDVPGGGQKGVITMYPLAGGSGVVEVQKGWTVAPPWVNGYVPIN